MFKFKLISKCFIYGTLGVAASLYISGCEGELPKNTQVNQVNGATVCDHLQKTPDVRDDCTYHQASPGYYYNPGSSSYYYRNNSGENILIDRNIPSSSTSSSFRPGNTVPFKAPVITDGGGVPMMNGGSVITAPASSIPKGPITSSPVRSTASFKAPGGLTVSGGKTTTAVRGVGFSSSGRGFGG